MQKTKWVMVLVLGLAAGSLWAQTAPQVTDTKVVDARNVASLDAAKEKRAFEYLMKIAEKQIISTVDAMPADKFGFAPTDGEFKGVRTFGQMVKHFSATNHILAAAALGEEPPAEAGDELGPKVSGPRLKFSRI